VTGVDMLDPLVPPGRSSGTRDSLVMRILAAIVLAAIVAGLLLLWSHR